MPYIKNEDRLQLEPNLDTLINELIREYDEDELAGTLNYVVTEIVSRVVRQQGRMSEGWNYRRIARAVSVFEAAKLEFYRRVAAPYEDQKIAENGDVAAYAATAD